MPEGLRPEEISTREAYDGRARDYLAKWQRERPGGSTEVTGRLSKFRQLLPAGRILEIGCGGGRTARWFVDNGYDYLGIDFSSGMLEQARRNNPGVRFEQTNVYDLDFDQPFDGFWCAAVLLHIPKNRLGRALGAIHGNMNPDAYGLISIKEGAGEAVESDGRFQAYWSDKEFSERLGNSGYRVVERGATLTNGIKWLEYIVQTEAGQNDNQEPRPKPPLAPGLSGRGLL